MEVTNSWNNNDVNKYYIITRDKETNEWKFFREIVGHTIFWKDKPSLYGMTKSKAIEVLNIVKNLTKEDVKSEPTTPTEPQYKIITISSVTYNSTEVAIFDYVDYNKLKSTLTYIDSTYSNTVVHVVTKSDAEKSIFYFYLEDELTWFLELKTNIDYALVSNVTTLNDIKELL